MPTQRAIASDSEPQCVGSDEDPQRGTQPLDELRRTGGRPSGRLEKVADTDDVTADLQ